MDLGVGLRLLLLLAIGTASNRSGKQHDSKAPTRSIAPCGERITCCIVRARDIAGSICMVVAATATIPPLQSVQTSQRSCGPCTLACNSKIGSQARSFWGARWRPHSCLGNWRFGSPRNDTFPLRPSHHGLKYDSKLFGHAPKARSPCPRIWRFFWRGARPGLLTTAAEGGLEPVPADRFRGA
jgi:hypothetical protein